MENYSRDVYLCWLASGGIPPEKVQMLLEACNDHPQGLLEEIRMGEERPAGVSLGEKVLFTLKKNGQPRCLDFWADILEKERIHTCVPGDGVYPERLLRSQDPPAILFYIGEMISDTLPAIAMVGSRSASWKGLEATERIAAALSEKGVRIVSGLAYGIDAAAHKGCLKGGSPTAAVLGCGPEQNYPAENGPLKRQILERGGVILSEYPPGDKPLGWHFPVRNRIISALADAVILMEARIRSGSMTTVQHALNQGRDVFVYPGEPDSIKCEGNHQLLREGAIYFTTADDILEDMGWLDKKKEVRQNSDCTVKDERLPENERAVLNLLQRGAMSLDELCEATGLSAGQMMSQLTMMQLSGFITVLPGKLYGIKG